MPALMRAAQHLFDIAAYEVLYRFSPVRRKKLFNGGYLPLASDMVPCAAIAGEEPAAMMYHLLLRTMVSASGLVADPRDIADIGCGQGGGLAYAHCLFPQASLAGTDRNGTALRHARKNLAHVIDITLSKGHDNTIAFPDASFDFVVSVGACTYFGLPQFVAETARICRKDGLVAFSGGYRQGDHSRIETELRAAALENGLRLVRYSNIAPHTFAALQADIPRRTAELNRVPWPFRAYGWKWADMPGSVEYEEYATGRRADFAVLFAKI